MAISLYTNLFYSFNILMIAVMKHVWLARRSSLGASVGAEDAQPAVGCRGVSPGEF